MYKTIIHLLLFAILAFPSAILGQKRTFGEIKQLQSPQDPRLGFMIHGGAEILKKLSPEKEKALRAELEKIVLAGYKALQDGKSSVDAVEIAIIMLESLPVFNSVTDAVISQDDGKRFDVSIMEGKALAAGSVAGVRNVKNPITLTRRVMDESAYVMLSGDGAEDFAKERESDKRQKPKVKSQKTNVQASTPNAGQKTLDRQTVGAVALDKNGDLAAGTSTVWENNRYGGVDAAAVIGSGTYAYNNTCAVSATGFAEYSMRLGIARDISAAMEYRALPVQNAADLVIQQKLKKYGGNGGVIAMDKFGNMAISFNSSGMFRAYISLEGKPVVQI